MGNHGYTPNVSFVHWKREWVKRALLHVDMSGFRDDISIPCVGGGSAQSHTDADPV